MRESRFLSGPALVAYLALLKFLVHFLYAHNYGYFVDELYYLACSDHLDWGYVDQAPLIALITRLERGFLGDSLQAIRFLPAVAGAVKVLLAGLIARELGGRRFAQGLTALAVLIAPIYLGIDHFLSMNVFEPLFWMGCAYVVIRIIKTGDQKLWLWFGLLAGIGLENKHSMLFFGFGIFVGLLLTPERRFLRSPWIWLGGVLAALMFLPNLLWEIHRGFPTLELLRNVQQSGRNVSLSAVGFMLQQVLMLHPLALPIWLAGLWYYLFRPEGRPYRILGWTYVVILACMLLLNGRVYYLAPAYPMLLAAGAVLIEEFAQRRARWLKPAYAGALAVTGALFAPIAVPILSPEAYIRYTQVLHLQQPRIETHKLGPLPQIYADMFGWEEMTAVVARAFNALPPEERAKTAIYGQNYGQAGAIDLFGPKYGLPKAIAPHQNYFYWGPRDYTGEIMIVMDDRRERLEKLFATVQYAGTVTHPYSMPYEHFDVFLCRGLKEPLASVWPRLKHWD